VIETAKQIELIFHEALGIEVPSASTDILAAGILDSLALVTLLVEIEQQFGVTLPLEDLDIEGLRTVERIADLVDSLTRQVDSAPVIEGGSRP
jgi:acyl carrier protein